MGWVIFTVACTTEEQRVDKGVADGGTPDQRAVDQPHPSDDFGPAVDKAKADLPIGPPSVWKEDTVGATVNAIWGIDAKNVFAVGKGGLIVRYEGGTLWKTMQNPEKDDLYAVYGTGPNAVFAGGDAGILAYDGTTWTNQASSYDKPPIRGMWGDNTNIFAVGPGGVMRYRSKSGTSTYWSSVYFGSTSGKDFAAIWGVGNDLFAVGKAGLILKCSTSCTTSTSWTTMTSGTSSDLQGVWGAASNDIFAVGLDGAIVHYNGTAWSVMPSNTSTYFYGVWGVGAKDVYAVGNPIFKPDEAILHYDGTTWSKMPPSRTSVSYFDVWAASATDVWAVGQSGSILHYTGP
jgi:hypothetical protein